MQLAHMLGDRFLLGRKSKRRVEGGGLESILSKSIRGLIYHLLAPTYRKLFGRDVRFLSIHYSIRSTCADVMSDCHVITLL